MALHHDFSLCSRLASISSSTGSVLPQRQVTTSHSCPAMLAFPETQAHPSFITTSGGGILAQPFGAPMAALWLTHRKARLRKDGTQTSPTGSAENETRDEHKRSLVFVQHHQEAVSCCCLAELAVKKNLIGLPGIGFCQSPSKFGFQTYSLGSLPDGYVK